MIELLLYVRDGAGSAAARTEMTEFVKGIHSIASFQNVGHASGNNGLIIQTTDGGVFHLTIVRSGVSREE